MQKPSRVRVCKECKRVFANPESLRTHKLSGIGCRSVEGLRAKGFVEIDGKWVHKVRHTEVDAQ